uniref:Uncharacterized LOC103397705 n=1 Tax=Cynoglossus semilaevis TaxID=244447 RepID=A0A3P8WL22_CYNSE
FLSSFLSSFFPYLLVFMYRFCAWGSNCSCSCLQTFYQHFSLCLCSSKACDAATMRMLSCRISKNPGDVEHYQTAVCDSSLEDLSLTRFVNVSVMNEVDTNCAPQKKMRSRAREEAVVKIRRKRGWIFPGTLWCGMNTKAATYDELGMFENADSCCREHDHCEHTIPSFTVNYGVFNPNLYTLSHCDCDQSFRKCLLGVNDTISTMVGYSFFNILRVPCFELKEQQQCTKMYWWGIGALDEKCRYGHTWTQGSSYTCALIVITATTARKPNMKKNKQLRLLELICSKNLLKSKADVDPEIRPEETLSINVRKGNHELLCKSLKHLDECRHQITPLEKKYGLWNKESKTVYHCNCTTRRLRVLPSLLTDFVSEQCFKLPKENKCQDRKRFEMLQSYLLLYYCIAV